MPRISARVGVESRGLVLCLLAAVGFGAGAVVGAAALGAGIDVPTFLTARFGLAAIVLWALVLARGVRVGPRAVVPGLLLGGALFAAESGLFFSSLRHIDTSLAGLVVYVYPSLVALGAVAIGRERLTARQLGALVAGSGGVALVLAGAGAGRVDGVGVALALGAAVAYAAYVLAGDRVVHGVDALALAALVCTGAALTFGGAWAAGGGGVGGGPAAWGLVVLMALGSTVVPMAALLAGVRRVGPSTASIVSTAEPLVTACLAVLLAGEHLAPVQWLGAAMVVAAVAWLRAQRRASRPGPAPVGEPV